MKQKPSEATVCFKKKCDGILFNVSSKLALGMGRLELQCDTCGQKYSVKVEK